jgi:hypothetical protein
LPCSVFALKASSTHELLEEVSLYKLAFPMRIVREEMKETEEKQQRKKADSIVVVIKEA